MRSTRFSNAYADPVRARAYAALEFPGTYYLAFRDLPELLGTHVSGPRAIDFGCGAGRSTRFLRGLGYEATGVDISADMIRRARALDPEGEYRLIRDGDFTGLSHLTDRNSKRPLEREGKVGRAFGRVQGRRRGGARGRWEGFDGSGGGGAGQATSGMRIRDAAMPGSAGVDGAWLPLDGAMPSRRLRNRNRRGWTGRTRGGHHAECGREAWSWNRIGLGEIELESLIQEEVTLRRAPGRGDGWGATREVEVEEDTLDDGRIGEEGQDPHVSATTRAQEWQDLATNASRRCPRARSWAQRIRAELPDDGDGSGT